MRRLLGSTCKLIGMKNAIFQFIRFVNVDLRACIMHNECLKYIVQHISINTVSIIIQLNIRFVLSAEF
jgi:hypothetical protein